MTRRHHRIHRPHFVLLIAILAIGAAFTLLFSHQQNLQIASVIATSIAYVLWGIIHHYKEKHLHTEIIIEYILIALFGATILISIILQS